MVTDKILLFILVIHFFGDFVLQTTEQAKLKHQGNKELLFHVLTYTLTWLASIYFMFGDLWISLEFALLTFIFHWLTDAVTSNVSKQFSDKRDYHNMFVVIGFGQILHYVQLYLTLKFVLLI